MSRAERIVVVGGGGREHALCWRIRRDRPASELYAIPGNGGIGELATLVPIAADDVEGVTAWCGTLRPDLVVVGPDQPLALGLVDALTAIGVPAFGPTASAARIEASKAWAADVGRAAGVPMPESFVFDSADPAGVAEAAEDFVRRVGRPFVVKADGLALGKGVFVCDTVTETLAAIDRLARRRSLGSAGERLVLQERLSGEELSVFVISDGSTYRLLGSARDHKRAQDGDRGPNTGGMGAYAPVPGVSAALLAEVDARIIGPVIRELEQRGAPFVGFLYAGLMLTAEGPRVIEFNSRMGDPEAQVLLPGLDFDLVEAMEQAVAGRLASVAPPGPSGAAVCVVLASGGYPEAYTTGRPIDGLDAIGGLGADTLVFHGGTRRERGRWLTSGGRVLGVTGLGASLARARELAYAGVGRIGFEGCMYRSDIAAGTASLSEGTWTHA